MVNGIPFAPMLDAQASIEQTVRRHLNGIMHAMGRRYAVSLILDDTMDASNSGVLSNSTDPWRAAVAAINAAAQAKPLDETVRQQIGKALGLQATAVVANNDAAITERDVLVTRLQVALMRVSAFCDENGKAIIHKALGGGVEPTPSQKSDGVTELLTELDKATEDAVLTGLGAVHIKHTDGSVTFERVVPRRDDTVRGSTIAEDEAVKKMQQHYADTAAELARRFSVKDE